MTLAFFNANALTIQWSTFILTILKKKEKKERDSNNSIMIEDE